MNAAASSTKSTTVRTPRKIPMELVFRRLSVQALAPVAPDLAAKAAARWFFTPRRRPVRPLTIEGLPGRRFSFDLDGRRIVATSFGEGPSVLLAHGWEGHAGQVARFVRPLVEAGFRAVAVDMPAHGASEGATTTAVEMARTLEALADISGEVEGVIAHSLGATAATLALTRGLPARRAVLLAPAAEPVLFAHRAARLFGLPGDGVERMLAAIEARAGVSFAYLDLASKVSHLAAPALILHDPQDREVPFDHAARRARAGPGAKLVASEGGTHHRQLRDPEVVEQAVGFVGARLAASRERAVS